ncbi:MAG: 50S ribosomal protein L3 N(5)-glutamine methyltransferase [Mesorhizobium sp.]
MIDAAPRTELSELVTLRDVLRYAVSCFTQAGLHFGHGSTTALDEAVFLILETLHLPIDDFNSFADARLTAREKALLGDRIARRIETRQPMAYIVGRTWLGGVPFRSDARALVPRSFIAELLASPFFDGSGEGMSLVDDPYSVASVLDLCTGGGSLAILAARAFPNAEITGLDLSADALSLASENVADHGLDEQVTLVQGDLFAPLTGQTFDLIITNPPYVARDVMEALPDEFRHEPEMALGSGEDGFDIVRRILAQAKTHLNPGGGILCEMGTDREVLEEEYPDTPFLWLDTANSEGEVFWLERDQLPG